MNERLLHYTRQWLEQAQAVYTFATPMAEKALRQLLQQDYQQQFNWRSLTEVVPESVPVGACVLLSRPQCWLLHHHGAETELSTWLNTTSSLLLTDQHSIIWLEDLLLALDAGIAAILTEFSLNIIYQLGQYDKACAQSDVVQMQCQLSAFLPPAFAQSLPDFTTAIKFALERTQREQHNQAQLQAQHLELIAQLQQDVDTLFAAKQAIRGQLEQETARFYEVTDSLTEAQQQLLAADEAYKQLQLQNTQQNELAAELARQHDSQLHQHQQQQAHLQQQIAQLRQQLDTLQQQYRQQQNTNTQLTSQLAAEKDKLKRKHAEVTALQHQAVLQQLKLAQSLQKLKPYQRGIKAKINALLTRLSRSSREQRRKLQLERNLLSTSELFDAQWYLEQNPDVKAAGINPVLHYLQTGASEGRKPSSDFDGTAYLYFNPDVATSGQNPLVHYLTYGKLEGRRRQ